MYKQLTFSLALAVVCAGTCLAQEWGTVKGKVVYEGDAPAPANLNITKDIEVCGKHQLFDESVVVGDGNGLANVAVYIYVKRGGDPPPIHESYKETATAEVSLDNLDCRFEPHITFLRTTQTLLIGNKDPVGHNTKIDCIKNAAINPIVPAGAELKQQFTEPESRPVPVSCSIHPWMKGHLLVKDHPYAAVTGKDGTFEIKNVPAGKWTFQFWHEKGNYLDSVVVNGSATKWKKGRVDVEVKAGDNDMGTIGVAANAFGR
jgi:hypothetical protein